MHKGPDCHDRLCWSKVVVLNIDYTCLVDCYLIVHGHYQKCYITEYPEFDMQCAVINILQLTHSVNQVIASKHQSVAYCP